jgi:hypothetical protein|tara:strand:- start:3636 stop:3923 length:288 start_codon:yes stop_codon:yes gene_type:complete
MATEYRRDSFYRSTTLENNKYLGVWEPTVADIKSVATTPYVIEAKYNQRPDKLAHDLYGNAKLWWAFALINQDKLNDPIMDFTSGISIKVPTRFT